MPEAVNRSSADFGEESGPEENSGSSVMGKTYLFAVGIDRYTELNPLANAVADAQAFVETVLKKYDFYDPRTAQPPVPGEYDAAAGTFNSLLTKSLVNASKAEVRKHVMALQGVLTADDDVVIYLSGHGTSNQNGFHFMPTDSAANDDETWINIKKLALDLAVKKGADGQFVRICKNLLLLTDCCYSGASLAGLSSTTGQDNISRYVIASALMDEKATDGRPGTGSPFRAAICKLLEENLENTYTIDEGRLSKEFAFQLERQMIKTPQKIVSGLLPMDIHGNGFGKFNFVLREKDIPPVDVVCNSFVKHLNFEQERKQFGDEMLVKDSKIAFVCLHEDKQHLSLMRKAIRDAIDFFLEEFKVSVSAVPMISDSKLTDGGVWWELHRHKANTAEGIMGAEETVGEEEKGEILKWLFKQASSDWQSPGFQILHLAIESTNKLAVPYIVDFCKELPGLYEKIKDDSGQNNRLLVLVTETKKENTRFLSDFRTTTGLDDSIAFVEADHAEKVGQVGAIKWLKGTQTSVQMERIKKLTKEELSAVVFKKEDDKKNGVSVCAFIDAFCLYLYNNETLYKSKSLEITRYLYED